MANGEVAPLPNENYALLKMPHERVRFHSSIASCAVFFRVCFVLVSISEIRQQCQLVLAFELRLMIGIGRNEVECL